jgi:hypothetical protein
MQLPETMHAVVLTGHDGLDKLEYHEDWPTPTPTGVQGFTTDRRYDRAARYHVPTGQPDRTGPAQTTAGAIFSAQGPRQGTGDVHAEAACWQYRRRNMRITRISIYRKSLTYDRGSYAWGRGNVITVGSSSIRGGRYRYRPLRLFTSAISGFRVEPDYDSIGDPVEVYA